MTDLSVAKLLAGAAGSPLGQAGRGAVAEAAGGSSFAAFLRTQLASAEAALRAGETVSSQGLVGKADVQSVVEAVTAAEMTLKEVTAIRDRVVAAYQEIMRMPI